MREILFRGKTSSGEWFEGDYVTDMFTKTSFINTSRNGYEKVLPEIVGQYTGLTDKNGKRIFEGDVVKTDKFSDPNKEYIVKYDLQFGAFIGQDKYNAYFVTFDGDSDQFEIIGNIHDNPELLKEGADNVSASVVI